MTSPMIPPPPVDGTEHNVLLIAPARVPQTGKFPALYAVVAAANVTDAQWGPCIVPDSWLPGNDHDTVRP